MTVIAWKLKDPHGDEIRCEVEGHDLELWELRVVRGDDLLREETHTTPDAALARAKALWLDYLLDGYTEL